LNRTETLRKKTKKTALQPLHLHEETHS